MDGLSAGASVIAVVSLAAQLGVGTHTLIKFLETVSDAPAEVHRLESLLGQIYAMATCVRNALEYQRRLHGDKLVLADDIHVCLLNCQKKVQRIERIVEQFKETERGRTVVSRKWAWFKLALKKEDVLELERQLGQAIQILDISLTTHSLASHARDTQLLVQKLDSLPSTRNQSGVFDLGSSVTSTREASHASLRNEKFTTSLSRTTFIRKREYHRSRHEFGVCRIEIAKSTDTNSRYYQGCQYQSKSTKATYYIYASFMSRAAKVMISKSGMSSPKISLQIMTQMSTEAFSMFVECVAENDMAGIQSLFGDKNVSMYSETLFSCAAMVAWKKSSNHGEEILQFLIHQGCQIDMTDLVLLLQVAMLRLEQHQDIGVFEILKLVCSRVDYAEKPIDSLFLDSDMSCDVEVFQCLDWLAITGVQMTTLPCEFYLGSALSVLVKCWNTPLDSEQRGMHHELARKLVSAGADLHYRDSNRRTLLQSLISHAPLHITCDSIISHWLSFLTSCGIDVRNYALQEAPFSDLKPFETVTSSLFRAVRESTMSKFLYLYTYECLEIRAIGFKYDNMGHPVPEIQRWVDPESPAALVLEEFNFCANLTIIPGEDCNKVKKWVTSWKSSPQDLRDVPISALYILADLGWDFGRHQTGNLMWYAGQDNLYLVDQGSNRPLEGLLQTLTIYPDIIDPSCPKHPEQERDESLGSIDHVDSFITMLDTQTTESTGAIKLRLENNTQNLNFCNCDTFRRYLDLWPFHGSTHTLCQTGNMLHEPCLGAGESLELGEEWCEMHKCNFNHARFERKLAEKIAKKRKCEGRGVVQFPMPGAWPV